jgi:ABC-type phosphate/phosphonate transport system permease subunit
MAFDVMLTQLLIVLVMVVAVDNVSAVLRRRVT